MLSRSRIVTILAVSVTFFVWYTIGPLVSGSGRYTLPTHFEDLASFKLMIPDHMLELSPKYMSQGNSWSDVVTGFGRKNEGNSGTVIEKPQEQLLETVLEELDLPPLRQDISFVRDMTPHNFYTGEGKVFATLLSTSNSNMNNAQFMAVQLVVWKLLWARESRSRQYPVVVFVAPHVDQNQRDLLKMQGAIVEELPMIEFTDPDVINMHWQDQIIKLNMWNQNRYKEIAFLDHDAFPIQNIDTIFDKVTTQVCNVDRLEVDDFKPFREICLYKMGVVRNKMVPLSSEGGTFDTGVLVMSPDATFFAKLLRDVQKVGFYSAENPESSFLNWVFRTEGAFPASTLPRSYNGFNPQFDEEGKLRVVHHPIWSPETLKGTEWLSQVFENEWTSMIKFYDSEEFISARKEDREQIRPYDWPEQGRPINIS